MRTAAIVLPFAVATSGCSAIEQLATSVWSKVRSTAASGERQVRGFVRVEDLPQAPPEPGFVRTDDLAPAPLVAVRPLKPQELTPQLIRRADDVLRNHEKPLGSQVVVDLGDKLYIARFEWHHHDDSVTEGPRGWHKGVTLYATE